MKQGLFDSCSAARHKKFMIEIMIERWSQRDGSTDWLWSIWQDGERRHLGPPQQTADAAEMEARAACQKYMGKSPDDITVL